MTESGIEHVEDLLGIDNLYDEQNSALVAYLDNAIKAREVFIRDRDYVVSAEGGIVIVDENTGRSLEGRRYNEGVHQAIEAKEGVKVEAESHTQASITLQNYFRLYDTLCGMTGTAMNEAAELYGVYGLNVVSIPTNKPSRRTDHPDRMFATSEAKLRAVVRDVREVHSGGQPVLIGTTSVEASQHMSELLAGAGIEHEVLNALHHEREAAIIAQAGRLGAVTVSTNMAGRGTDILLGGNPEHLALEALAARGLDPIAAPEHYESAWESALAQAEAVSTDESEQVRELGGLFIIGTERHDSRRIDDQLAGRAGRQGDPGASRFYVSLEDDLLRHFNPALAARAFNGDPDEEFESKMLTRALASAQSSIEARGRATRKEILKYDDVVAAQRKVIYAERVRLLTGKVEGEPLRRFADECVRDIVRTHTSALEMTLGGGEAMWSQLSALYPLGLGLDEIIAEYGSLNALGGGDLEIELCSDMEHAFAERRKHYGARSARVIEPQIIFTTLDELWREHLDELDALREGIHLRSMAQRDPVSEYQREAAAMFADLVNRIKHESVRRFFGGLDDVRTANAMSGRLTFSAPNEQGGCVQVELAEPETESFASRAERRHALGGSLARRRRSRRTM